MQNGFNINVWDEKSRDVSKCFLGIFSRECDSDVGSYHDYADLSENIEIVKFLSGVNCRVCVQV